MRVGVWICQNRLNLDKLAANLGEDIGVFVFNANDLNAPGRFGQCRGNEANSQKGA
jgi:hypothetical protein